MKRIVAILIVCVSILAICAVYIWIGEEPTRLHQRKILYSENLTDFDPEYRAPFVNLSRLEGSENLQKVVSGSVGESHEAGWTYTTNGEIGSSPVIKDVNKDGKLEILLPSTDGYIYLLNYKGENLPGWPKPFPQMYEDCPYVNALARSVPAIGDIDNDGEDEIVARGSKYIHAWNLDGSYVEGWPVKLEGNIYSTGRLGSPVIADLEGDGFQEIITGHLTYLHVYNHNGTQKHGWPKTYPGYRYSTTLATPNVADLDGDGDLEVVFEVDTYDYTFTPKRAIHLIGIWHHDGNRFNGWPVKLEYMKGVLNRGDIEPKQAATTLVADVDNDKEFDIIVPTWNEVYVFNLNGMVKYNWPITLPAIGFLSLGDFDDDGLLEIVTGWSMKKAYLYNYDGSLVDGWYRNVKCFYTYSSTSGNIDDDPESEIVFPDGGADCGANGKIYAWNYDGSLAEGKWPKQVSKGIESAPALGDLDGDGDVEIVAGSHDSNIYVWDLDAEYIEESMQWPMFHHDPQHTGTYPLTITGS